VEPALSGLGRGAVRAGVARLDGLVRAAGGAHGDTGPLSGGRSVHPGAGVPMAALSGRLAAQALMADRAAISRTSMPR